MLHSSWDICRSRSSTTKSTFRYINLPSARMLLSCNKGCQKFYPEELSKKYLIQRLTLLILPNFMHQKIQVVYVTWSVGKINHLKWRGISHVHFGWKNLYTDLNLWYCVFIVWQVTFGDYIDPKKITEISSLWVK